MAQTALSVRYTLMLAATAWGMEIGGVAFAESGGYEGLIAPSPSAAAPARSGNQEPAGYEGLIPGRASDAVPAEAAPREPAAPRMTTSPALDRAMPAAQSAEDIKLLSSIRAADETVHSAIRGAKLPDDRTQALAKPRPRIENMLPAEYMVKKNIDELMLGIKDAKMTPEARAQNISKAREKLVLLAGGLLAKTKVPDDTYRQMGLSDGFITEEREGLDKALSRLNRAIKELDKY